MTFEQILAAFEAAARDGFETLEPETVQSAPRWGWMELPRRKGYYRVRVSSPLEGWTPDALQRLAEAAEQADGGFWITSGQTLEFTPVHYAHVAGLVRAVLAAGGETAGTLGEGLRPPITSPLQGVDPLEAFDPAVEDVRKAAQQAACPGFFQYSISASPRRLERPEWRSAALMGCVRERSGAAEEGFDLWLGGDSTRAARSMAVFIPAHKAGAVLAAVIELWRRYRASEPALSRASFADMIDASSKEDLREALERLCGGPLDPLPPGPAGDARPHTGVFAEREPARYAVAVPCPAGRVTAAQARRLADAARRHGQPAAIRFGADQQAWLLHIPESSMEPVLAGLQKDEMTVSKHPFESGFLCSPSSLSGAAPVDARSRGHQILEHLKRRVHWQGMFRLHVDESPAGESYARFADIGLIGSSLQRDGRAEDAFAVWAAGSPAEELGFCIAAAVEAHELPRRLEQLLQTYKWKRRKQEPWGAWCRRMGAEKLRDFLMADPEHPLADLQPPEDEPGDPAAAPEEEAPEEEAPEHEAPVQ